MYRRTVCLCRPWCPLALRERDVFGSSETTIGGYVHSHAAHGNGAFGFIFIWFIVCHFGIEHNVHRRAVCFNVHRTNVDFPPYNDHFFCF